MSGYGSHLVMEAIKNTGHGDAVAGQLNEALMPLGRLLLHRPLNLVLHILPALIICSHVRACECCCLAQRKASMPEVVAVVYLRLRDL